MRIIAVSDLHGEVAWLTETIDRYSPDLLLSAGDWGDPGLLSPEDFAPILRRVRVLSIYGNHDNRELMASLRNRDGSPVLIPQGGTRRAGRLMVGGISGIWAKTRLGSRLNARWEAARRRNPSLTLEEWLGGRELPPYVTDEDVAALAEKLSRGRVDVLVTHACASGLADRTPTGGRGGQRSFRQAADAIRPRLHLCGHLHHRQRQRLPDGRLALNCGHGAEGIGWLIDWNGGRVRARALENGVLLQTPCPANRASGAGDTPAPEAPAEPVYDAAAPGGACQPPLPAAAARRKERVPLDPASRRAGHRGSAAVRRQEDPDRPTPGEAAPPGRVSAPGHEPAG